MSVQQIVINDYKGAPHTYEIYPVGARQGMAILRRITKVAPSLVTAFAGAKSLVDGASGDDVAALTGVLKGVLTDVMDELSDDLIAQLLEHVMRDGKKVMPNFDSIYQQNYGELALILAEVIKVNFGPALQTLMGKLQ